MDKFTARELIAEYLKFETILRRITEVSSKIEDAETRDSVRRAASDAQCYMYEELVRPVLKEYPALAPHGNEIAEEGEVGRKWKGPGL